MNTFRHACTPLIVMYNVKQSTGPQKPAVILPVWITEY